MYLWLWPGRNQHWFLRRTARIRQLLRVMPGSAVGYLLGFKMTVSFFVFPLVAISAYISLHEDNRQEYLEKTNVVHLIPLIAMDARVDSAYTPWPTFQHVNSLHITATAQTRRSTMQCRFVAPRPLWIACA